MVVEITILSFKSNVCYNSFMNTDFEKINLPRSEIKILKLSAKHEVDEADCKRLLHYGLVYRITRQIVSGDMPVSTGKCRITDLGEEFLVYRRNHHINSVFIPAAVAFLTSLLTRSLEVLWPLIQGLLLKIFSR